MIPFRDQQLGVPGPCTIFLKLWYTDTLFQGHSVRGVAHTWGIDTPTVDSFVWEPPVPFEMAGTSHLLISGTGKQRPWWEDRCRSWRRQPFFPEKVGYGELSSHLLDGGEGYGGWFRPGDLIFQTWNCVSWNGSGRSSSSCTWSPRNSRSWGYCWSGKWSLIHYHIWR